MGDSRAPTAVGSRREASTPALVRPLAHGARRLAPAPACAPRRRVPLPRRVESCAWGKGRSGGGLDSSVKQLRSSWSEVATRTPLSEALVARKCRRLRRAMELATIAPTVMRPEYTRNSNSPTTRNNTSETAASPYSDKTKSREQGSRTSPAVVDLNQS